MCEGELHRIALQVQFWKKEGFYGKPLYLVEYEDCANHGLCRGFSLYILGFIGKPPHEIVALGDT